LGLEETCVRVQVSTVDPRVEGFRILAKEGHEALHDRVKRLIPPRACWPIRPLLQPQGLTVLRMLEPPAAHGVEPKDPTRWHEQETYDYRLVRIHEGMPPLVPGALRLQTALKQRQQQLDIVGTGRDDHRGSSWNAWWLFARRNPLMPAMSRHLCPPLSYVWKDGKVVAEKP
jgi:hypothetical protein